jgi:hypothetical protein
MKTTTLRELIRESIQGYIREIDMVSEVAAIESKIAEAKKAMDERQAKLDEAEKLNESGLIDEKKVKQLQKEVALLEKYASKQEALLEKKKAKMKGKNKEVDDDMITEEPMEEIDGLEEAMMETGSKLKARYITNYEDFDDADFEFYDDQGNTLSGYGELDDEWFTFETTGVHPPEMVNKLKSIFGKDVRVIGPSTGASTGEEGVYTISIETKAPNFLSKIEFEGGKSRYDEGKTLNESFLRMQKLAGLITETQYYQKKKIC